MIASTFSDNHADAIGGQGQPSANQFGSIAQGGGLSIAPDFAVGIAASTFDRNVADSSGGPGGGGGISLGGGAFIDTNEVAVSIVNETFFADIARTSSGGSASAGALFAGSNGGDLSLTNSTITSGSALGGRSNTGGDLARGGTGPVTVENTLITAGVADNATENCSGAPTSLGHNLDSLDECGFHAAGDLINANPMLGPLQDNGAPPLTIGLGAGSAAIDRGASADCPTTDERGALRPAGLGCDIGAFEVATPSATTDRAGSITSSSAVLVGRVFNPDVSQATAFFQYGPTNAYGNRTPDTPVSAAVKSAQISAQVTGLAPATTYHFRVVIVNSVGTAFGTDGAGSLDHRR